MYIILTKSHIFARHICCEARYFRSRGSAGSIFRVSVSSARLSLWSSDDRSKHWNQVVADAEKIVGYPTSFISLRCLLSDELSNVAIGMRKLVGTRHPLLKTARGFVYDGKHNVQTRGLIVLLMAKAAGPGLPLEKTDWNDFTDQVMVSGIYPRQRILAEVTEMIHTANLIHKGVVNMADITSEDGNTQDMEIGNKMAILSGDFLLANASTGLAQLNNTQIVEIISSAIGDLMEAEFTKFRDSKGNALMPLGATFSDWLHQTFLSSGSLLAKSCQAAMKLSNHCNDIQQAAFEFGKNMAYAHQLNEDLQPFLLPHEYIHRLTIASAPVIRFVEAYGSSAPASLFCSDNTMDSKKIVSIIKSGTTLQECHFLCREYGQKAARALDILETSEAKSALLNIIHSTCTVKL